MVILVSGLVKNQRSSLNASQGLKDCAMLAAMLEHRRACRRAALARASSRFA
jgi:hypothetical protein